MSTILAEEDVRLPPNDPSRHQFNRWAESKKTCL